MGAAILLPSTISTGPPYLWLVPMCTIFFVKGLHHRKCIAAVVGTLSPCVAYITIIGIPGWVPTEYKWPKSWTSFHLGCNPSLQVWLWERGRQALIDTMYRNYHCSVLTLYLLYLSRSSPKDPAILEFRSVHVLHGPMHA